ncbi:MAG TPA: tetratricopeptide repeat protein [Thermoanaerobaculia bacterium]|nr:tetratricopeptide repeat protein [Thermoanaerobaculia bacterium]
MRTHIAALALALTLCTAALADDRTDCTQSEDHAVVSAACGRLIASESSTSEVKAVAHANIGNSLRRQRDFAAAIGEYSEAIKLNPQLAVLYFNRGVSQYANGDPKAAIADFSEAIRLDPKDPQAYVNRAIMQFEGDAFAPALADMDAAIKLAPKMTMLYTYRGKIHLAAGNAGKAIADFKQVLKLEPANADAKALLADLGVETK